MAPAVPCSGPSFRVDNINQSMEMTFHTTIFCVEKILTHRARLLDASFLYLLSPASPSSSLSSVLFSVSCQFLLSITTIIHTNFKKNLDHHHHSLHSARHLWCSHQNATLRPSPQTCCSWLWCPANTIHITNFITTLHTTLLTTSHTTSLATSFANSKAQGPGWRLAKGRWR